MDNSPFGLLKIGFLLGQTYGRFNSSICYAKRMDKPIDNLMNNLIAYGLENRKRFPTSYRLRLSQVTATLQQVYPHFELIAHKFSVAT